MISRQVLCATEEEEEEAFHSGVQTHTSSSFFESQLMLMIRISSDSGVTDINLDLNT